MSGVTKGDTSSCRDFPDFSLWGLEVWGSDSFNVLLDCSQTKVAVSQNKGAPT